LKRDSCGEYLDPKHRKKEKDGENYMLNLSKRMK
jgi:hypothetical protein